MVTGAFVCNEALLRGIPDRVHVFEAGFFESGAFSFELFFDGGEAVEEFFVGSFERDFRIHAEFAGEVGYNEKEVSDFSLKFCGRSFAVGVFGEFFFDLAKFLFDFFDDAGGAGPVEAHFTGFLLEFGRAKEGREAFANSVEVRFFFMSFFGALDVLPLGQDTIGVADVGVAVYMGMAANEFVGDAAGDFIEIETALFLGEFGVEDDLEK